MLLFLLFKTKLTETLLLAEKVHTSAIANKLNELASNNDDVREFLAEMVDGWDEYTS